MRIKYFVPKMENLASYRIRFLPQLEAIQSDKRFEIVEDSPDIFFTSKHFSPQIQLNMLKNYTSVFDVCDNHFETKGLVDYYKHAVTVADYVTCNTLEMRKQILKINPNAKVHIIPDSISMPKNTPNFGDKTTFLWFGHISNIDSIIKYWNLPHNLIVITNDIGHLTSKVPIHSNIILMEWRQGLVEDVIKDVAAVLIPKSENPAHKTKSPNRVVDSIISGKWVISDNEDLRKEFSNFCWIGSLKDGINHFIKNVNNSNELISKIEKGQEYCETQYGRDIVTAKWKELYLNVCKA
jgi:hypothetical protein